VGSSRSKLHSLPLNVLECDPADRLHYIVTDLVKAYYLAPIDIFSINSVLDLVAGNGLWCIVHHFV
jgi:hypothetical protein